MLYIYKRYSRIGNIARRLRIAASFPYDNTVKLTERQHLRPRVNWGCSLRYLPNISMLNRDTSTAVSKVRTFDYLRASNINVPRYNTNLNQLRERIGEDRTILARKDRLSQGEGIHVIRPGESPPAMNIDFYVERLSILREWRVHVWLNEPFLIQAKLQDRTNVSDPLLPDHLFTSRNLDRWACPALQQEMQAISVRAITALGLDFGAVDLIVTKRGKIYVLEANTAPGITSEITEQAYADRLSILKVEREMED